MIFFLDSFGGEIAFNMKKNKTEFLPYMLNREEFHVDSSINVKDKTRTLMKENIGKYLGAIVVKKRLKTHVSKG